MLFRSGEHLLLGGQLALKFLATELSRNPQFIRRFRQEARAAYLLRHPNIVEVADLDQDEDGSLFIAMEYVAGPSLRAVLHQAPHGLPVARALHIARGLAAAIEPLAGLVKVGDAGSRHIAGPGQDRQADQSKKPDPKWRCVHRRLCWRQIS